MGALFYGNGHMSVDIHPSFERSVSMRPALAFSENARVMLLAVHPDDDVLAAGGLLQQAAAAGAAIRIIFITDGDNNPWPQRVIERRWRIEAADRVRWGVRRRAEALASLACLGIAAENAVFWGYPDQGLTEILLKESKAIADRIRAEISSWQPTLLVSPSLRDLHPDHNALGVLVRFALKQFEPPPQGLQEISYLVHYKQTVPPAHDLIQCCLLPEQKAIKSKAILCHETQLVLCRRRFLAYATQKEHFLTIADSGEYDTSHPVDRALVAADALLHISLAIRRRFGRFGKAQLYIATDASSATAPVTVLISP
jgi:LmbE family N-acetylglucosaminyl deacetylase